MQLLSGLQIKKKRKKKKKEDNMTTCQLSKLETMIINKLRFEKNLRTVKNIKKRIQIKYLLISVMAHIHWPIMPSTTKHRILPYLCQSLEAQAYNLAISMHIYYIFPIKNTKRKRKRKRMKKKALFNATKQTRH